MSTGPRPSGRKFRPLLWAHAASGCRGRSCRPVLTWRNRSYSAQRKLSNVVRLPQHFDALPDFASLSKSCDLNTRNRPKAAHSGCLPGRLLSEVEQESRLHHKFGRVLRLSPGAHSSAWAVNGLTVLAAIQRPIALAAGSVNRKFRRLGGGQDHVECRCVGRCQSLQLHEN